MFYLYAGFLAEIAFLYSSRPLGQLLAAMSAHTPVDFGLFFYASHVTNYEPGGVVVDDMIGRLA